MNSPNHRPFPWATAIIAAAVVLIAALTLWSIVRTGKAVKEEVHSAIQLGNEVVKALPEIASKFKTGTITQTFRSGLPEVVSTGGDILELAVLKSDETFTRADKRMIAWDTIYLGTTVAEIRVPVTFRYHLRLSDKWLLASRSNVCVVLAPKIRPSLPPAIHTAQMEKRSASGWALFDKFEVLDDLQRSLTPTLEHRAADPMHMAAVRESCRRSVAEFVKNWLLREDHWRSDRFTAVIVVFPDEANFASEQDLALFDHKPALRLE
jgi:hypothetical protein